MEMDLQEVGRGGVDWIDLARIGTGSGTFICRYEPFGCIKCGEFF